MLEREQIFNHPALIDPATGLANQLHFELVFTYLFEGADRGVPLTMMFVDVGSHTPELLREMGTRLKQAARSADLIAHMEGSVLAILLVGTNLSGARLAADRLESVLDGLFTEPLSFALIAYNPYMKSAKEFIDAAYEALKRTQERGGGLEMVSG